MPIKKLKAVFLPCLLVSLLFISIILLLNNLLQKPSVQLYLIKQISRSIGYELSAKDIEISFWGGIGISAANFEAKSPLRPESIVAPEVRVIFNPVDLLKGQIAPNKVFLSSPRIELPAPKDLSSYIPANGDDHIFKKILLQRMVGFPAISLEGAEIIVKDFPFRIESLYLDFSQESTDPISFDFRSHGDITFRSEKAAFKLKGSIEQGEVGKGAPSIELILEADKMPLSWMPWSPYISGIGGSSKAKIDVKGALNGPLSVKGKVVTRDLGFFITDQEVKKRFAFNLLTLDFESFCSTSAIDISSMKVASRDFSLTGGASLDIRDISNPYIDLRVESSRMSSQTLKNLFPTPLLPEYVESRIFPIFSGGDVSVGQFSLKGTKNQIGNLHLPENAGALFLQIIGEHLEAFKDSSILPFKDVSGELIIKSGTLNLSSLKAKFGNSDINDTSLQVNNLYSGAPTFHTSVKGNFDLEDLKRQGETDLIPDYVRKSLKGFGSISGSLEAGFEVDYEESWDYPKIRKAEFRLKDCSIFHQKVFLPFTIQEALLKIGEKGNCDIKAKGLFGESGFDIVGTTEEFLSGADITLAIGLDMNDIAAQLDKDQQIPVKFKSPLNSCFSLYEKEGVWSCHGEIDLEGFGVEASSFSMEPSGTGNKFILDLDLQSGGKFVLKSLLCNFGESVFNLSGSYDLKNRDFLNFKVLSENISLEDLGILYKRANVRAKGLLVFRAEVNASLQNRSQTYVKGEIEAKSVSCFLSEIPSQISDLKFKIRFKGKEVFVDSFKTRIGHSPFHISGNLRGWDGLKGNLTVKSEYVDVSDLIKNGVDRIFSREKTGFHASMSMSDSISHPALHRFMQSSEIGLKFKVLKGQWKTLAYGPLNAECVFQSGNFIIKNSMFEKGQGILTLKGHVLTSKNPEMLFSGYIKMTGQPVKEYLQILGIKESLDGILTLEGVFYTRGRDKKEMISSLTGSAVFLIEKGKIQKSNIILQVLEFLSLQNIFVNRPTETSGQGFYFKSISGNVVIDNGVIESNNLIMKSPVLNGAFKGSVDLCNDQIDFDMGIQPLGTIDFLVSKIPIVGYILTGKEKSILVYYFKVTGPLSKPEVQYVPLKNWGTGLEGFFERLFLTPSRIIKGISNLR